MRVGVADAGANIGIASYSVARFFRRAIVKYDKPIEIHGAGTAKMMSSHYADFGRVLGRFALLPGEDVSTLISISNITDQGLTVSYSKSGGVSIVSDGEVVVSGHFDPSSRLFYFDIGDVLEYSEEEEMDETAAIATAFLCSYSASAVADNRCDEEDVEEEMDLSSPSPPRSRKGRRGERIPQWLVAAIMDLHNRVGHPSAKVTNLAVSQQA